MCCICFRNITLSRCCLLYKPKCRCNDAILHVGGIPATDSIQRACYSISPLQSIWQLDYTSINNSVQCMVCQVTHKVRAQKLLTHHVR